MVRKIIHIDMDAFYASIEQRDNTSLKDKPIAVGGSIQRGVVMAASYEARRYGIHSAMPSALAIKKCPELIFIKPRFEVYRDVSKQIRDIFHDYTDLVEPLSLDEAYLDVTTNKVGISSATLIAREIKQKIKAETALTASAGISVNKFLAKIASDYHKPDGLTLIPPEKVKDFIDNLPVEKFHGIGKVTAARMHQLNIHSGYDLRQFSENTLIRNFGKAGKFYHQIAHGIDNRGVNPHRIRKSVGAELTFKNDLTSRTSVEKELDRITMILYQRMEKNNYHGKTLSLKIKYSDFRVITRSRTVNHIIKNMYQIKEVWSTLLDEFNDTFSGIRLLGLTLSNLSNENNSSQQLTLGF